MPIVRLKTREGAHLQDVSILPFQKPPELLVCGDRFFIFDGELKFDGDPCTAEYRETFAYVIPPALCDVEKPQC